MNPKIRYTAYGWWNTHRGGRMRYREIHFAEKQHLKLKLKRREKRLRASQRRTAAKQAIPKLQQQGQQL